MIAGSVSVELNDLSFELTPEERETIGGCVAGVDTTDTSEANRSPNEGGGASVATVSGITNQMEGLMTRERSPEQPEESSPSVGVQETQQNQTTLAEASAMVGAAALLEAASRGGGMASLPPPSLPTPTVRECVCVCVCVCVRVGGILFGPVCIALF